MPFGLGIWEIAILAGLLVLLFGAKGATGAAKSLGRSVREVQDAVKEVDPRRMFDPEKDEAPARPAARAVEASRVVEAERAVPMTPSEANATPPPPRDPD